MTEALHVLGSLAAIFAVVFSLNVLPAFAPPTWTVLSFIAIRYDLNIILIAVTGAIAATLGRVTLAKLANVLVRRRLLSEAQKKNVDAIKTQLEGRRRLTFAIFLFYAFSPLPSNHLFIAYGLTAKRLKEIAIPFLLGRLVSYAFWAFTASRAAERLEYEAIISKRFATWYFILSQLFGLLVIYLFTRVDWHRLFTEKRLGWRK